MIKKILFISSLCLAVGAECQTTKTKLIGLGMTPELAQYVASLSLSAKNDQYLQGRNAANTAFIDVLKVDSTDDTVLNSDTAGYRDWETDRKSTRLNSSHRSLSRMPSSA